MENLTRKTLIFLCILLLITLIGVAYGLKPRPMWSTDQLSPSINIAATVGLILSSR